MEIRRFRVGEESEIWALFYETVHKVNSKDYTPQQINAWAPSTQLPKEWIRRLKQTNPFVALFKGRIIGFAELGSDGHIDCFYCAHDFQRKGVGKALFSRIEEEAGQMGIDKLFTEASISAVAFFKSRGFEILDKQIVEHNGEKFANYSMYKYVNSEQVE